MSESVSENGLDVIWEGIELDPPFRDDFHTIVGAEMATCRNRSVIVGANSTIYDDKMNEIAWTRGNARPIAELIVRQKALIDMVKELEERVAAIERCPAVECDP